MADMTNVVYDKIVVAFKHKKLPDNIKTAHIVYIKQSSETGGYQVAFKRGTNEKVVYSTQQFLSKALMELALLLTEFGIGHEWVVMPIPE